jgi:tol-pal system protein YbgF
MPGMIKTAATVLAALLLAGCYGKQLVKGPIYTEQTRELIDSLFVEQDKSLEMVIDMRGQLEEEREMRVRYEAQVGLALKELEESIRILTSQLEDRAQMQSGAGTRSSYPPPVSVSAVSDTAAADSSGAANPAGEAEELYRTSYMDLTRGNYELAIQGFQNYLVRHPSGSNLPEVHYYLGESYYARERHLEAVSEFQYVVREFPGARLVRAAYLKSGLCYVALEESNLARRSLQELVDKYPDSEEAVQARGELDKLQG